MSTFLSPGSVHVDTMLTNLSVAYLQNEAGFIADKVFPRVPVAKQSDRYYTYSVGAFNRDTARLRAPGTASVTTHFEVDNTPTYYCDVYGQAMDIAWETIANADAALDVERDAMEVVTRALAMKRERLWASTYFATSIWSNNRNGVASSPSAGTSVYHWSDYTNGSPITDIRNAMTTVQVATGMRPNTLIVNRQVMDALEDHPEILDRIKYNSGSTTSPAAVTTQSLAALFGLSRVMISEAVVNTADQGQTDSQSFVMGKHALLCYVEPRPGLMKASAGYTFVWRGMGGNDLGVAMRRFDGESMQIKGAIKIDGQMSWDQKVVAADLGYFFNGIVA